MKHYVVHTADGTIIGKGVCPDGDLPLQAKNPGEFVLEGVCDDQRDKVEGRGESRRIVRKDGS